MSAPSGGGLRPRIALCTARGLKKIGRRRRPKIFEFLVAGGGQKKVSHAKTAIFPPTPYRLRGALPPGPPGRLVRFGIGGRRRVVGVCRRWWAGVCRRGWVGVCRGKWVGVCRAPAPRVAGGCCCCCGAQRHAAARHGSARRAIGAPAPAPRVNQNRKGRTSRVGDVGRRMRQVGACRT